MNWDVFISHATEDKAEVATPLAGALTQAGLGVWYDTFELKVGDRLGRSLDTGLRDSRFGIVILSPSFFRKHYPLKELDALAQRERNGQKVILPVWYNVSADDVLNASPMLADRIAVEWSAGLRAVVAALMAVIRPENPTATRASILAALLRLKAHTRYLWAAVLEHMNAQEPFSGTLKTSTLRLVENDLALLRTAAGLDFTSREAFCDSDSGEMVHELTVHKAAPIFWELVANADQITIAKR